jgi:chorismate dehydratase
VKSIALDEGSRTSAALSKILMNDRFGIRPDCLPLPIHSNPFDAEGDAVLVIGDRAMKPNMTGFISEWDLGEEWYQETGLPFVFAMWVGKKSDGVNSRERSLHDLELELELARDRGVSNAMPLSIRYASEYGLTVGECYRYLSHHLRFRLGTKEQLCLKLFYEKATHLGLAPQDRDAEKFRMATT